MPWLSHKRIVIVGGTTGLGLSAAQAVIAEGAQIIAFGRSAESAKEANLTFSDRGHAFAGDATDPESTARAIQLCIDRYGGFDALYHVAGGSGRAHGDGPLDQMSDEGWRWTLDLNLTSVAYSNRAAIRRFLQQKAGGVILNMGSVLGSHPSPQHFTTHAYAAAKSALIGLTKSLASHYAKDNIRVNLITPALVETPMSQRAMGDPKIQRYIQAKQPLDGGRAGRPGDLDAAVVFLLSDGARFVTGQNLSVDGGWSISEGVPLP